MLFSFCGCNSEVVVKSGSRRSTGGTQPRSTGSLAAEWLGTLHHQRAQNLCWWRQVATWRLYHYIYRVFGPSNGDGFRTDSEKRRNVTKKDDWGLSYRFKFLGSWVLVLRFWVLVLRFWVLVLRFWVLICSIFVSELTPYNSLKKNKSWLIWKLIWFVLVKQPLTAYYIFIYSCVDCLASAYNV